MFRPYHIDDYPGRRLTISAGEFRVALHVPDSFPNSARFCDPPGLEAALELKLVARDDVMGPDEDGYLHRDANGYTFASPACRGRVDREQKSGQFELVKLPADYPNADIRPLLDVALSACFDEVVRMGGLVLHGAAVRLEGRAYVMCGPSERGKTTLFSRFNRHKVPGALTESQLGDEWSFVAPDESGQWHYWWYPYARAPYKWRPATVPLGGVLHIGKNRENTALERISLVEAMRLTAESAYFIRGLGTQQVLDNAAHLAEQVPAARITHHLQTPVQSLAELMKQLGDNT